MIKSLRFNSDFGSYDVVFRFSTYNYIARHCSSHDCDSCKFWTCAGKEV